MPWAEDESAVRIAAGIFIAALSGSRNDCGHEDPESDWKGQVNLVTAATRSHVQGLPEHGEDRAEGKG